MPPPRPRSFKGVLRTPAPAKPALEAPILSGSLLRRRKPASRNAGIVPNTGVMTSSTHGVDDGGERGTRAGALLGELSDRLAELTELVHSTAGMIQPTSV